ncbi:hypothetical protein HMPREF3101_09790 [Corynebacterium sp. HMSC29G08]|nr:hypothetical protein HMPREF3101_09790 [Corynebacterium sp. HMSC29G08]
MVAAGVSTVFILAGAFALLHGGPDGGSDVSLASSPTPLVSGQHSEMMAPAADYSGSRPDCVAGGVGGVDLPCLGGAEEPGQFTDITLVNVWAWWCVPCREELPVLDQFARAHPEVSVVGVHADANADNGIALLDELDVSYPSYQDDSGRFAGQLALPNVVPLLLVYKGGEQVAVHAQTYASVEELEALIGQVS